MRVKFVVLTYCFVNRRQESDVRSCVERRQQHHPRSLTPRVPLKQPPASTGAPTGSSYGKRKKRARNRGKTKRRPTNHRRPPLRHAMTDPVTSCGGGLEGRTVSPVFAFSNIDAIHLVPTRESCT